MKKLIPVLLVVTASAWNTQAQSYYHDMATLASFGGAVAIGDGHLLIGESTGFKYPGTVHVYTKTAGKWQMTHQLQASDARVGDGFGSKLVVDGNAMLIAGRDAVYFFEFDGSTWTQVMQASIRTTSLALDGDMALLGMPGRQDAAGAVHVYQRSGDRWTEATRVNGEVPAFGRAVAMDGGVALIGAAEAVTFYQWDGGAFVEEAQFMGSDLGISRSFGMAVHLSGNEALVGSAMDQQRGSVQVFRRDGTWQLDRHLRPESQAGSFGSTVVSNSSGYWVGAPFANRGAGEVHHFPRSGDAATVYVAESDAGTARFGVALAASDELVFVGMPSAAYGEGSVAQFSSDGGAWTRLDELHSLSEAIDPIFGDGARCDAGAAAGFECGQVDLVSFLPLEHMGTNRGVRLSDVWGWTDPESDKEYGLVGHLEGTAFVDLSDPSMPIFLGELPRTTGSPGSTWRDIKVYKDHAFIVADGAGAHGMQVFDLRRLRSVPDVPATFDVDARYDGIHSSHNIVINEETGFAYAVGASGGGQTCGGGLHMIDIREPLTPTFAGCFADESTGRRKTGYSHDAQCVVYHGPDAAYQGREICIGANEIAISIADITDKENPVVISSGSYPDAAYVHQGWLSEDHAFFYQNDELDELNQKVDRTRTLVWDVSDLDDPILANEYFGPTSATDHNLYVRDNLMYQTNNASGLRILDITNRAEPKEVGFFDTTPYGTDESGFNGTWSSYPYFKSGIIVVTSRREGLFILKKQSVGS